MKEEPKFSVRMLKTTMGCDDGVVVPETYWEGKTYTVGKSLYDCFVDRGEVELVESRETKVEKPAETKVESPAETKAEAPKKKNGKK